METLKDFLSDLKERLSNPFLSSFVISWLICNYQIFISLFFYKLSELSNDGSITYLTVIKDAKNNSLNFWIIPLIIALVYTFIIPYAKSGLKIYQAWILTGTDKRIYQVTDTSVVSIENHTKVSKDLKETKAQYADLIENESTYKIEIETLKVKAQELGEKHNLTINKLNLEHEKTLSEQALAHDVRIKAFQEKAKIEELNIKNRLAESNATILDRENVNKLQRDKIENSERFIAELRNAKKEVEIKMLLNEEENTSAIMEMQAENNHLNEKVHAYNIILNDLKLYLAQYQNQWTNEPNSLIDKFKIEELINKIKNKLSNFKEVKNN